MADGEINRNGATIRIDDDGGVQVEPAEGQEVEYTGPDRGTDAIRDSVNTVQAEVTDVFETVKNDSELDQISFGDGTHLLLSSATFDNDRTFSERFTITGTSSIGTEINGIWTVDESFSTLKSVLIQSDGELVVNNGNARIYDISLNGEISINADECVVGLVVNNGGPITFEDGTSDGEAGLIVDRITVTDNGNNRIL